MAQFYSGQYSVMMIKNTAFLSPRQRSCEGI